MGVKLASYHRKKPFTFGGHLHSDSRGVSVRVENYELEEALQIQALYTLVVANPIAGTVRGFHFQPSPLQENKFLRVISGSIFDVCIDLSGLSNDKLTLYSGSIPAASGRGLFIPAGYAHAYQTLEPNTVISYRIDKPYDPKSPRGFSPMSASILQLWPVPISGVSDQDLNLPDIPIDLTSQIKNFNHLATWDS